MGAAFDLFVCVDVSMFCMYASLCGVLERSTDGGKIFYGCMHACVHYICVCTFVCGGVRVHVCVFIFACIQVSVVCLTQLLMEGK